MDRIHKFGLCDWDTRCTASEIDGFGFILKSPEKPGFWRDFLQRIAVSMPSQATTRKPYRFMQGRLGQIARQM